MENLITKISIIIPLYNTEKYISECILSILNQTYKNIEIIVINDGSTDHSEEKCLELQKTDKRIKYIYQNNAGVTAARKRGVENATGGWISFVDADDILVPNAIQTLVEKSKNHDIVIGDIKPFYNTIEEVSITSSCKELIFNKDQYIRILLSGTRFRIHGPCAKIYKKELFDSESFAIPRTIKRGEDFIMNVRLGLKANSICYSRTIVYLYRQHNSSTIHAFKTSWEYEYLFLTHLLKPFNEPLLKKKYRTEILKRKIYCIGEAFNDKNFNDNDSNFIKIKKEIQSENIDFQEKCILYLIVFPPFIRYNAFRIIRKILGYL